MNVKQALSLTGNELQTMNYEQLSEVVRAMAETARKRIARNPEGSAYERLKGRALGRGRNVKVDALSYKDGKVRISQRFKGSDKMSMSQLRALRKELSIYLKDETSTRRGLIKHRKEQEELLRRRQRVTDIGDDYMLPMSAFKKLDMMETDSDAIYFGKRHLGWWDSEQIKKAILKCANSDDTREAYRMLFDGKLTERLKEYVEDEFYNQGVQTDLDIDEAEYDEYGEYLSSVMSNGNDFTIPMEDFDYRNDMFLD